MWRTSIFHFVWWWPSIGRRWLW